jgi:hypothetical protein
MHMGGKVKETKEESCCSAAVAPWASEQRVLFVKTAVVNEFAEARLLYSYPYQTLLLIHYPYSLFKNLLSLSQFSPR